MNDLIKTVFKVPRDLYNQIFTYCIKNNVTISAQTRKLWADFLLKDKDENYDE